MRLAVELGVMPEGAYSVSMETAIVDYDAMLKEKAMASTPLQTQGTLSERSGFWRSSSGSGLEPRQTQP